MAHRAFLAQPSWTSSKSKIRDLDLLELIILRNFLGWGLLLFPCREKEDALGTLGDVLPRPVPNSLFSLPSANQVR
jgi:hypothetical protein